MIDDNTQQPAMPACWYSDTMISIMKDEIFPFSWDIELTDENTVSNSSQCSTANNGRIIRDTLQCVFKIYNRDSEAGAGGETITLDCEVDQW